MPAQKLKFALNLNLLKPQSNPEKLPVKFLSWLLSSGRYLFVLVNGLVLLAFLGRFKLDADLAANKEAIDEQLPYLESMKPYENLIKNTQLKLTTMSNLNKGAVDFSDILEKIAAQTPTNIKIGNINIEKNAAGSKVHVGGQAQNNNEINAFVAGLKSVNSFSKVTLSDVEFEQSIIKFAVDINVKLTGLKNL